MAERTTARSTPDFPVGQSMNEDEHRGESPVVGSPNSAQASREPLSLEQQQATTAGVASWIKQRVVRLSVAGLVFLVLTFMHALALLVFKLNAVDGSYPFSSASTVVVTEAVKLCLATALHQREIRLQPATTRPSGLVESFRRSASRWLVFETCIVSAMYTGNNLLSYYCVAQMDPGTLAIAKSLVPYLTAIVLQLFGRTVNGLQWACIILQCTGVATTQYADHDGSNGLYSWSSYAWLAISVAITTISSVCNERVVRRYGAPLQQVNMIMYSCGIALASTVYVAVPAYHEKAFFEGYSPMVGLLIFVQATYGLCVGYAYKCVSLYEELPQNRVPLPLVCHCARRYADVLIKNLSSSATLAVLVGLSALLFGTPLTHEKVAGSIVIICTSYIYVQYAHRVVQEGEACVSLRRICAHFRAQCFSVDACVWGRGGISSSAPCAYDRYKYIFT